MQGKLNSRLSNKLFFAVMGTALLMGLLFSIVQIMLDARQAQQRLEQEAQQTLTMMRQTATRAALAQDQALARQVVQGLFRNPAVFYAAITLPERPPLASDYRDRAV